MSNISGITVSRELVKTIIETWLNANVLREKQSVTSFEAAGDIVSIALAAVAGAESPTAPSAIVAPVEPVAPQPAGGRKWGTSSTVGAANRARVAELAAQGKDLKQIVTETGMKQSTAYGHLQAIKEAAAGGNGFRGNAEYKPEVPPPPAVIRLAAGERWCVTCGETVPANDTQCPWCDSQKLLDPLTEMPFALRRDEYHVAC